MFRGWWNVENPSLRTGNTSLAHADKQVYQRNMVFRTTVACRPCRHLSDHLWRRLIFRPRGHGV
ncbi:hypothetical protein EMIT047CA2_270035 [Pseudomonas soli]